MGMEVFMRAFLFAVMLVAIVVIWFAHLHGVTLDSLQSDITSAVQTITQ